MKILYLPYTIGPSSGSYAEMQLVNHYCWSTSYSCHVSILSFQTQNDFMLICNVAKIVELVVPLMDDPSETFLTTIEEDLMKLIIKHGMMVRFIYSSTKVTENSTK